MPLVEVEGVTKRFGGLEAVRDVDFAIDEGRIVSLIGPNGAGKTTMFNMLTGLETPTEGVVRIGRINTRGWRPHAIAGLLVQGATDTIFFRPEVQVIGLFCLATLAQPLDSSPEDPPC